MRPTTPGSSLVVAVAVLVVASTVPVGATAAVAPADPSPSPSLVETDPSAALDSLAARSDVGSTNDSTNDSEDLTTASEDARSVSPTSTASPTIDVTLTVDRTPGDRTNVSVTQSASLPDNVASFTVDLSHLGTAHEVTGTNGYAYDASTDEWEWDETTENPTLTYRVAANTTASGGYDTVETDGWAFVGLPQLQVLHSWRYYDPAPAFRKSYAVAGDGYAADGFAFAGPVDTYQASGDGQTVTLVVPTDAAPAAAPQDVADAVAGASRNLSVGDVDPQVVGFVAPEPIRGGGLGGGNAFWVDEGQGLGMGATVWFHEYTHTRQAWTDGDVRYDAADDVEWLTEASADYVGAYLAWTQGNVDAATFRDHVATTDHEDAVLQDADAVSAEPENYDKGRRVLAALDIRIRQHTDGNASFLTVLDRLNGYDAAEFTYADLRGEVVALTNASTGSWLDTYVTTSAAPDIPTDVTSAYDVGSDDGSSGSGDGSDGSDDSTPPAVLDDPPTDPDGDGLYEDVNGDGRTDVVDVQALFVYSSSAAIQDHVSAYDVNGDGKIDVLDAQALFAAVV